MSPAKQAWSRRYYLANREAFKARCRSYRASLTPEARRAYNAKQAARRRAKRSGEQP